MAGTFVFADNDGANIATLTGIAWGTAGNAPQAGDIAILPWSFQNTATPTDPTSEAWTLVTDQQDGSARLRLLTRTCTGSESGTISGWTMAINRQTAVLAYFRGYAYISGFQFRLEGATALNTHANPTLTTADGFGGHTPAAGDTIVIITCTRDGATTVVTAPAGYAKRANGEIGLAASGGTHTAFADDGLTNSATFPTTPAAWTGYAASSANAVTITLALRPLGSTQDADASLAGIATIAAGASKTSIADAAVTGAATITPDASKLSVAAAALTATAGITASASVTRSADVAITVTAARTVTAAKTAQANAAVSAVAAITGTAAATHIAGVSMNASAIITAAVDPGGAQSATASLVGTASIVATASVVRGSDAALTASAAITPSASKTAVAGASVIGTASIAGSASAVRNADANLTVTATRTATAASSINADLTATATITATASVVRAANASLVATAIMSAIAARTAIGNAALSGVATITSSAGRVVTVTAQLVATASITTVADSFPPYTPAGRPIASARPTGSTASARTTGGTASARPVNNTADKQE